MGPQRRRPSDGPLRHTDVTMAQDPPPAGPGPARLLVVEDNEKAREGLATILRREGYEAVLAANGQEALDLLRVGPPPDLIILDMLMPVLDGWHFLETLKRRGPRPLPNIVITTGTNITLEWALDHGCQGFLRKPIQTEALLAEVRRCLGEPP
jgi:CheY-like chemotaxis protein